MISIPEEFPGVTTMERNTVGYIRHMLKRGVYKVPGSQCGSCCWSWWWGGGCGVCVGRGSSREDKSKFLIPRAKDRGRRVYFLDKH